MEAKNVTLREALLAAVGMVILSLLFCGPYLPWDPDAAPFAAGDSVGSYLPYFARAHQPLSPAVAGAWDPTLWTGLPESHSPFGRYYPPAWLLFVCCPLGLALSLTYVVHHALAGFGTYLLMRTNAFRRASAWLAAMVFAFSSFMLFHRPFVTIFQTAAWLPLILWALESFRGGGNWIWIPMAGTFLALHGLAGHFQTVVIGGMVWVPYAIYFMLVQGGSLAARLRFGAGIGLACVLGAAGAMPQILPMVEVAQWTPYAAPDFNYYKSGSFEPFFLAGLAGPWMLGGAFDVPFPGNYIGPPDAGCSFGLLGFAVGVVGLCAAWRRLRRPSVDDRAAEASRHPCMPARADVGFWILLYLFHVLLMLGRRSPLYTAFFALPVYHMFHMPVRHLLVVSLAASWFVALGLEQVREAGAGLRLRLWRQAALGLALLAAVCAVIVLTLRNWPDRPGLHYPGFWIPVVCGLTVLALIALTLRSVRRRPIWIGVIVVLTFVELSATLGHNFFSPLSTSQALDPERFPAVVRVFRDSQDGDVPARCLIQKGAWCDEILQGDVPNAWGQVWGLSVLNCYSQSMPRSLAQLLHLDKYGRAHVKRVLWEERGLSALGGRFVALRRPPPPAATGLGFLELGRDDIWRASAPRFSSQPGQPSRLHARTLLYAKQPYLLHGELVGQAGPRGAFHIKLTDFGKVIGDFHIGADLFTNGRCEFAYFLEPLRERDLQSGVEIHLEATGDMAVELTTFDLWSLKDRPADTSAEAARRLVQQLRDAASTPYLARPGLDAQVYENPQARSLATLVREVRPAEDDLAAARGIVAARDRSVKDLAIVVAPQGTSHDLTLDGPRAFAAGSCEVVKYVPDDVTVKTQTDGEGFLVLTVTRCRGWSATVDGEAVPLHAVDGPLMGVRVPPGTHVVRFQFRPVLLYAGTAIAGVTFALAWGLILMAAWRRKRRRRAPSFSPVVRSAFPIQEAA